MIVFKVLRMVVWFAYFFGYMVVHLPVLRRGEKALADGDIDVVRAIVDENVPRWCGTLLRLGGVRVVVTGRENIPAERACVFVANHRSYFDIPILLTALDGPHGILAKQAIDKIPLVRRWMRLLGCVFVVREDVRASMTALNTATETVRGGQSFCIFPEGTRYKGEEGGVGEFKGGAFRIAVKTGAPVVPLAITGTRGIFETHHNIITSGTVTVHILPPIEITTLDRAGQKALPDNVREVIAAELTNMLPAAAQG